MNKTVVFVLILLIFGVVQTVFLFKYQILGWDESVYVGMTKYVVSAGKIGLWENLRPIGLPLLLAGIWVLDLDIYSSILISKVLMLFLALSVICLTFFVGKKMCDNRTGIFAAALTAFTPFFIFNAELVHTEISSTLFGLASICIFAQNPLNRKNIFLCGLFLALSFLFKFPQGILLIAFLLTIFLLQKNKNLHVMILVVAFFVPVFLFLAFNRFMYGDFFLPFVSAIPHQNNPTFTISFQIYNIFYYPFELIAQNIFFVFAIPALIFFLKNKGKQKEAGFVVTLSFLLLITYFTVISNKQIRYAILFLPYLAVLSAQGFFQMLNFFKKYKKYKKICVFATLVLFIWFLFIVSKNYIEQYDALPNSVPEIINFYDFAEQNNLSGPILTVHPSPAAYSNKLFIPFYNNVDDAVEIYGKNENLQTIMYTSEFYPCTDYADQQQCAGKKQKLFDGIKNSRNKVYYLNYGQEYFIFSSQNLSRALQKHP